MKKIILMLITLILIGACSNVDYTQTEKYPEWVTAPTYENGIAGVGSAKINDLGFDFARKEAMANARADLARQIGIKVNATFKSYVAKSGADRNTAVDKVVEEIYKDVVSQDIVGSRLERTWESPEGELFVLMVVDNEHIINGTVEAASEVEDEGLEELRSKEAQEQLRKELENFFN